MMSDSFSKIAPYLSDPLILVGFFIFSILLVTRLLFKSEIIPQVARTTSGQIVKLFLHYGFLFGLLLLCLAFLYKYRELELAHTALAGPSSQKVHSDIAKQISVEAREFTTSYPAKNPVDGALKTVEVRIRYPQISGHPEKKLKGKLTNS